MVASSSGGSVLAALFALKFSELRNGKDFEACVKKPIIQLARLGLRERIVRRIPWLWLFRRLTFGRFRRVMPTSATALLASYYDSALFLGATMDDLRNASPTLQTLILATNVSEGGITAFSERTIGYLPPNLDVVPESIEAGLLRVSKAVAASSAFPALFPPIELDHVDVGADDSNFRSQWFTDAGVSDNLAFDSLVRMRKDLDLIIISDAGRSNVPLGQQSFGLFGNALRSSDLMLFRISELARERARWYQGPRVQSLSISHTTKDIPGQSPEIVQRTLERIRTDFDRFTLAEIDELVRHGWCVARDKLRHYADVPAGGAPSFVDRKSSPSALARSLQHGAFRRYKLFGADDWMSWAYSE